MDSEIEQASITIPDQKNYEYSYGQAFKMAAECLSRLPNLEEQCRNSGSNCKIRGNHRVINLKYLDREYEISIPDVNISQLDGDAPIELRDKILVLHYVTQAKGTALSSTSIAYQELKEGATYYPSFFKRAIKPLTDFFGQSPERLIETAKHFGGYRVDAGDVAVTIPAFERVPITLVLWKGDDEFPPNANILFNSTILDYLSVEDINILCQTIVWSLVKSK